MDTTTYAPLPAATELQVDGVLATYHESGAGAPMLLLHGWPQTAYVWRKVLPELAQHYRVLALELPGMGNGHPTPTADTKAVARFLKAFCDQLGLGPVHLVAHDVGAWVAVTFALEYEASLQSLIVLDAGIPGLIPAAVFSPLNAGKIWQFYFHAIEGMPEFLIAGKEKEYLYWYFDQKTAVKDAITDADAALYTAAYAGQQRLRDGFAYYRAFAQSAQQNQAYRHQLTIPILAIGGEQAQGLNVGLGLQKIAAQKIEAVSLPLCGHYIVEEQPAMFLKLIAAFLQRQG